MSSRLNYLLLVVGILMVLAACGRYGWEPVEDAGEEKLNVMAILALDDSVESFVVVHRTLGTRGPSFVRFLEDSAYSVVYTIYDNDGNIIGFDTTYYDAYIDSSLYLVPGAEVFINDGSQDYRFIARDSENENRWYQPLLEGPAAYFPEDTSFSPLPNTTYTLRVTAPDGLSITGSVTTPPIAQIHTASLADTLSVRLGYKLTWDFVGPFAGDVATGIPYPNDPTEETWEEWDYICGSDLYGLFQKGDTSWTAVMPHWCVEDWVYQDPDAENNLLIRLRLFEERYYNYFIVNNEGSVGITNFLLGPGNIGVSEGIEGGYGVFGAYSAARVERIVIP